MSDSSLETVPMDLKIVYPLNSMGDDARDKMEEEIRSLLKRHGWVNWASGAALRGAEAGRRDMVFERINKSSEQAADAPPHGPPCRYPFDKENCRGCDCGNCAMRRKAEEYYNACPSTKRSALVNRPLGTTSFIDRMLSSLDKDSDWDFPPSDDQRISDLENSVSALQKQVEALLQSSISRAWGRPFGATVSDPFVYDSSAEFEDDLSGPSRGSFRRKTIY